MKSKILLYGICITLLIVNFVAAGPKHTGWPLEVLSWDINKAYPGIEYNYRLGVKGGEYPYEFTLVDGPSGMTINKNSGEIVWKPVSLLTDTVVIKISDISGNSLVHRFAITSTTNGFYFVDGAKGNNSNNGSEASPWKTMTYASATADSASYVYVKKGTYSETFTMAVNKCGRFFAYPGDSVIVIGAGTGIASFSVAGKNRIFQGFTFNGSDLRWIFSCDGTLQNLTWRKNHMYNCSSTGADNPAFIFFWNGSSAGGTSNRFKNIVVQDNVFHDLRNTATQGGSVTAFDVQNLLYENNVVYDIDGRGINIKDNGYMSTIRNNTIYSCIFGVGLMSQGNEISEEICYNHIYNCTTAVMIGFQSAPIDSIFIHHNTILGPISFGAVCYDSRSGHINIYKNIIGNGKDFAYVPAPIKTSADTRWRYDTSFLIMTAGKIEIDSNLIWPITQTGYITGSGSSVASLDLTKWQSRGFDKNSRVMQLELDLNRMPILPDSLKIYGNYGGYGSTIKFPINPTQTLPNRFSPDKSASEVNSLFQEIANNASKGTRLSFKLQDETIKMAKIEIFSLTGKLVSRIIMDVNGHVMPGNKIFRNGRYFVVLSLQNSIGKESVFKQVVLFK